MQIFQYYKPFVYLLSLLGSTYSKIRNQKSILYAEILKVNHSKLRIFTNCLYFLLNGLFSITEFKISNCYNQKTQKNIEKNMSFMRHDTLKEILPTMKRIWSEQEVFTYSLGNTYKQNGLILKHKVTNLKIKNLVSTFIRKIKRNLINSKPIHFQLKSTNDQDDERICNWTGWEIQERIQGFIMFLDIIMTLVTFFMGAFQGFLDDFRNNIDASTPVLILKVFSMVVFVVRLVLVMITVDYENDKLYLYITDIVKKQLAGGDILLHIFSMVMVFISLIFPEDQAIGILFFFSSFLKLALIRSNLKILELRFIDSIKKFYIWNLVRIIIFDIIFAHIISTALLAAARINTDNNWITVKLVNNNFVDKGQTWYKVYIWSYYWACTIMMTVGFGDISPVDYRESIVVAFIEIFSSIVLAYNISEVGSIVSSIRKSSQELERKLGVLRRMSKKNPIPQELQQKIESYLTHELQIRDKFEYNQHRAIIDHLPEQLKQEYFSQSNSKLYSNIPLFRYFQRQCLAKLNRAFSGKVYYPGEYIIKFRTGNHNIIIIRSGQFGLSYWKPRSFMNGAIVQSISIEQNSFEGVLITTNILSRRDSQLNYDIVSLTYSYGMQLNLQTFLGILRESKLDYYYYKSVLDRHEKEPNPYDYVECEYCPTEYHTKFDCTKLHYIPIRSERFLRHQTFQSTPAPRCHFQRRNQHIFKHCYLIRSLLSSVEKELPQFHDGPEDVLKYDEPFDFSMYFKQFNPDNVRNRKTNKSKRSIFRALSLTSMHDHA